MLSEITLERVGEPVEFRSVRQRISDSQNAPSSTPRSGKTIRSFNVHYPGAETVRVVLDNLSAHKPAALYEVFAPELARNVLRRLEFHFVPKHASWLNMVEIEIGVLGQQCLDRRIADRETLQREVAYWERRRNAEGARVEWLFDVRRAREKLGRVYPSPSLGDLPQAA